MAFGAQTVVGLGIAAKPDQLKFRFNTSSPAAYKGDPMKLKNDGTVERVSNASDTACGIFEGVELDGVASDILRPYRFYYPGSLAADAWLSGTNPHSILTIESSASIAATDVFLCYNPTTTTGSTTTGISGVALDTTTGTAGTGATFQVIGKADIPNNEFANTTTVLKVIWKRHAFAPTAAGV